MHVVFRESHGLDETDTPTDLGQSPGDLVVLSFSDSDLGAFAEGWYRGGGPQGDLPTLRLANIAALRHPLSVDTYVEQTLSGAKGILIRLIGGVPYWSYGIQQIAALAREKGIALAVLPGDGRQDGRLDEVSTLPVSTLRRLSHHCDTGGAHAAQAALAQLSLASGLYARPVLGQRALPMVGGWTPVHGAGCPSEFMPLKKPKILVVFYRSYLVAEDLAPLRALFSALEAEGFAVQGLFVPSLKAEGAAGWLARQVAAQAPVAIVNATAFSGRGAAGVSPLDAGRVPVFQVALSTSNRKSWEEAERGLSPADLAMHVVLPEVDGRLFGGVISFKEPGQRDPHLEIARMAHQPHEGRVRAVAARIAAWHHLAKTPRSKRRLAMVLSTYPGRDWNMAHAVGLDPLASAEAMMRDLAEAGYDIGPEETGQPGALEHALSVGTVHWSAKDYRAGLAALPEALVQDLEQAWGAIPDQGLSFRVIQRGTLTIALQPERGQRETRDDDYHDLARVPCHAYVGFYLWLQQNHDALIHLGAHGTLEWLPGKAVALSEACWPEALTGTLPVLYPFIVNDPGEAAQAKRRIGAVTLGHVPPPLTDAGTPERFAHLEALLDEFSNADGLDPRRRDRLQTDIRSEAQALGLENDLGVAETTCEAEALTRIDRFVCDIKESQFGEGLHIWGRLPDSSGELPFDLGPSVMAERQSVLDALDGWRIDSGPSGSPYRGRQDVMPTGRNLFTTDPRSVPTRAAFAQGKRLAQELVRRHLQDNGDWPRNLVVDLWGSATMRTAGEEFAMALALLGVRPIWDKGSERVSGIEVLPIAELDHPRLDVTLRVSGLFRDVFPSLSTLFQQAVRALSKRDEALDWNPFVGKAEARVFGPKPGQFGLDMGAQLTRYDQDSRQAAGEAWIKGSAWSIDGGMIQPDETVLRQRVAAAEGFVHAQDLPETDLLMASDYASHEAGFAAAQAVTGGAARLYHLDNTNPDTPRARELTEEIARVVRARASNPVWVQGMMRHGFRGGAEIAVTLENMGAFAHLAEAVPGHLFDLYWDATLGDDQVCAFLSEHNPGALEAMQDRFRALHDAGLWQSRRNAPLSQLLPAAGQK